MSTSPQWFVISVKGLFIGRCYCTLAEIKQAAGPYCDIIGNGVDIWNAPPKAQKS